MLDLRLYAIVLRLSALRPGAVPADHGDQARAALLNLIRSGDLPLSRRLHDANTRKPYTVSLLNGGKRGRDGALHFGMGDSAEWRFTLLHEPAFEALLRRYIWNQTLPHVRIGAVEFQISNAFASGSHPDSGSITLAALHERWNVAPETLPRSIVLDFLSPTAFNLGQDRASGRYRIRSTPDARTLFSTLRKHWLKLGGVAPGDEFDTWVGERVETRPLNPRAHTVFVERRPVESFSGRVSFTVHGSDVRWLPLLHLLADLAFWTGVGYQTSRGMGQVRRVQTEEPSYG